MATALNEAKEPAKLLLYEAYYKYHSLNRLMRYLAMSLGLLESYNRIGEGFRFDAFEPFRDALLQTYLIAQNLLERSQDMEKTNALWASSTATSNNGQAAPSELLHHVEREKLLACVKCLAGCVEFSGVGDEKRYLEMCREAHAELHKVQELFHRERFWYPKWLLDQANDSKSEWDNFVKGMKGKDAATLKAERVARFENQMKADQELFEQEMQALTAEAMTKSDAVRNAVEVSKAKLVAARSAKVAEWKAADDAFDAYLTSNPPPDAAKLEKAYEDFTRLMEAKRILFRRDESIEIERERQEWSRTARARDPVLYRSHGPNSYSASKRPKSANTKQRENDAAQWNPWRLEVSQFLLSASRSIGVLRASSKSETFRYDAFQPFLGALRDTFELCDKYLKRNETVEEYLTVSERNTLLAAVVGLAGCVTFTGVAEKGKYKEICDFALQKLELVVNKLSGAAAAGAAVAAGVPVYQQPPQQQQQSYFAMPQQQQYYAQPQQYYGAPAPGNSLGYWSEQQQVNSGQTAGGYYYGGYMPHYVQSPAPYTAMTPPPPQLQQPPHN